MSDANGVGTWSSVPGGSWFVLLNSSSTNAVDTRIDFTAATIIGQRGGANITTDAITVLSTGLYEITISGWTAGSTSPYLTVWNIRRNGTTLATPHYEAPLAAWGTQVSTTQYTQLNANDVITVFLVSGFAGTNYANQATVVSLTVKLIQ
jgi:hypothetical protein